MRVAATRSDGLCVRSGGLDPRGDASRNQLGPAVTNERFTRGAMTRSDDLCSRNSGLEPRRVPAVTNEAVGSQVGAIVINVQEVLPPSLDSTSQPPSLFDGTTRLYTNYQCPFAQRAWITRNVKGLQDKIKLVPIDLQNRPDWYKEKVYPPNKVPSLEHNNKVIGESLDLIKYIDSNFEGPSLLPDDPEKRKFAEELIAYSDTFVPEMYGSFKRETQTLAGAQFDYLEKALHKFDDGPFFLGQFSQVDIAYVPFIERFQIFLKEVFNYDITSGRPKLAKWIEEVNKVDGYKQTKVLDPKRLVEYFKSRFLQA